ncbi:MAG: class I SAM-dependent methyltransferase [Candidatus Omnitrophica bacterium]|nr:class I SAM-dependent methyltransferase [Candidatus Omnitrophota bacterium]
MNNEHLCPVCLTPTFILGSQTGLLDGREFLVRRCPLCRFFYVENYRIDFDHIYNENYYRGSGADPTVDYVYELENPLRTIRGYEWKGIFSIYKELVSGNGRWLDYGCGGGGLVRFAVENGVDAIGCEEGWIAQRGQMLGIPIIPLSELNKYAGSFDFVSAIEVLEHIPNPIETLLQMRKVLKPGGILFVTMGNAEPWRERFFSWDYVKCPDVHISFYEPETLKRCLSKAGFLPREFMSFNGFVDIIKFKVLKTLHIKNRSHWIDVLPWEAMARVVDKHYKVSRQPYGVAIEG